MIERVAFLSAHTSPLVTPGVGDGGGMNVYVDSVARTFAALGIEVDVFTARQNDEASDKEVVPGYRVIHIDSPGDDRAARIGAFAAGVAEYSIRRSRRYDIVHSHYWLSGWAGLLLEDPLGAPLVISFHTLGRVRDVGAGEPPPPLVRIAAETEVIARAGCVVASTPADAHDLMTRYGAHPERVCVSPPGVDHGVFHQREPDRARFELPDTPIVAVVGRIQPLKRIDLALHSISELPDAHLVVVGGPSGPAGETELERLRRMADEIAPGRVEFRPPMKHDEDLARFLASIDLLAIPSRSETFGLVAVEAQACGTPVVASRVGGLIHAVADGESGLLVEGEEVADWSKRIGSILGDPELRGRLSDGAVINASQYSWSATAARLLELYRGLV